MTIPLRANLKQAMTAAFLRWKSAPAAPNNIAQQISEAKHALQQLSKTTEKLRQKENSLRFKRESLTKKGGNEGVELEEENRVLREKLAQTEANVGVFVREMGSLLD